MHNLLDKVRLLAPQHFDSLRSLGANSLQTVYTFSMWHVYILLCEDSSLYTGISDDPDARFEVHKSGKGSKYTRSHKPTKQIYLEEVASRSEALKRELEIKSWTREKKIRELGLKTALTPPARARHSRAGPTLSRSSNRRGRKKRVRST